MDWAFYQHLADDSLAGRELDDATCQRILSDASVDTLPLVNAAFAVRKAHWGMRIAIHILNNAQNGNCPEDCSYCTQARSSSADIHEYGLKSDDEVLAEAGRAHGAGAHRYCMVYAGRGPSAARTRHLARLVRTIKQRYPMEVCVSAGLLDEAKAKLLADAGLDRLNHNLNTSRRRYASICSTHTYDDRLATLRAAQSAGLQICSGLIVGMGETPDELIEIAKTLRALQVASIPVNFLLPFEGNALPQPVGLSPQYCLRVLCLFRFLNPRAEVRVAAGREFHLRKLEVLSLYAANSLFLDGYLNGRGAQRRQTYQMLLDAGFTIESEYPLEALLADFGEAAAPPDASRTPEPGEPGCASPSVPIPLTIRGSAPIKSLPELRPTRT